MVTVQEKKYCCGCAACVEVCPQKCIKYTFDEEGFGYPEVEAMKCVHCGLCNNQQANCVWRVCTLPLCGYRAGVSDYRQRTSFMRK